MRATAFFQPTSAKSRLGKTIFNIILLLAGLFLTNSCDIDNGLAPLESGISGTINYIAPDIRPATVGEVRMAALLQFPPTGLGDLFFSEPLDFSGDSTNYFLPLPPDDYVAVVLLWREKGQNWSFNSLLGVYGFTLVDFALLPISIKDNNDLQEDVDMLGLWNFAGADAKVSGTINYSGTRPADTEAVLLAGFTRRPNLDDFATSLLFIGGIPLPMATTGTRSYELRLFQGHYEFIGLFWKGTSIPIEEMKLIGYYAVGDSVPGELDLVSGQTVPNINFNADYSTLPEGVRF